MKGFVEVIQEEDHCLTGLLPKDIDGKTCKKRRRNMSRNAINARGLHPIFISLRGMLNPLSSPWPFAQWGLDIVGPFPKAVGNKKYLLVCTDFFTK